MATKDVLPYSKTVGNRACIYGINSVGLLRRGFGPEAVRAVRRAYRVLLQSRLNASDAVERLESEGPHTEEARILVGIHPLLRARGDPEAAASFTARLRSGRVTALGPAPVGLIAGNGRFPFLVARGARRAGRRVVAVAIREETAAELASEVDEIHWVGLGQLGACIAALRGAGAREAVMAGQVQHSGSSPGSSPT